MLFVLYLAFIVQFAFSLLHQSCKKRLVLVFPVTDLRVKDESVVGGGRRGGEGDNANCSSGEAARAQCSSAGAEVWVQISDIAGKVRGCSDVWCRKGPQ